MRNGYLYCIRESEKNFGEGRKIQISHTGSLRWEVIAVLSTACTMDVMFFPFDSQQCNIQLVSLNLPLNVVNLKFLLEQIHYTLYQTFGEWLIEETLYRSVIFSGDDYSFSSLIFSILIKRHSGHHIMLVIFPTILTAVLAFVAFFLPFKSGIRIGYILTVVLASVVLLTLFADTMPATTLYPSILVASFAVTLGMSFLLIIITIILMKLYKKPKSYIAPKWMHSIVRTFRNLKCRARRIHRLDQNQAIEDGLPTDEKNRVENKTIFKPYSNKELAEFFDHFLFIVFIVLYVLVLSTVPITAAISRYKYT